MNASTKALWLAVIILASVMVGVAAGVITWISSRSPYAGIIAGGSSFGGAVLVLLAMAAFVTAGS